MTDTTPPQRMIALGDGWKLELRGDTWHLRDINAPPEAVSHHVWDERPSDGEITAALRGTGSAVQGQPQPLTIATIDERHLPPVCLGEARSYEYGVVLAVQQGAAFCKRRGEATGDHSVTKFWRMGSRGQLQYTCLRHLGGSMWQLDPWFDTEGPLIPMDADPLDGRLHHNLQNAAS
jgi:hypothetical protein